MTERPTQCASAKPSSCSSKLGRETSVKDPFAEGKRLAVRVMWWQMSAIITVALAALVVRGDLTATIAVLVGGLAAAAGHGVFALRHFAGIDSVSRMLNRFFGAAAIKWLVLFLVFGSGLVVLKLPGGAMLVGLITAQLAGTWALLRYG